jgi:hypothetical protein
MIDTLCQSPVDNIRLIKFNGYRKIQPTGEQQIWFLRVTICPWELNMLCIYGQKSLANLRDRFIIS